MKTARTDAELDRLLPEMEDCLLSEGLPLYLRPQECFKKIYGSVHDKDGRGGWRRTEAASQGGNFLPKELNLLVGFR